MLLLPRCADGTKPSHAGHGRRRTRWRGVPQNAATAGCRALAAQRSAGLRIWAKRGDIRNIIEAQPLSQRRSLVFRRRDIQGIVVQVFFRFGHAHSHSVLHVGQVGTSACATRTQRARWGWRQYCLCPANTSNRSGRRTKFCTNGCCRTTRAPRAFLMRVLCGLRYDFELKLIDSLRVRANALNLLAP
eukprot:scaffold30729_cov111-Isochrysis_galbana.AAC.1